MPRPEAVDAIVVGAGPAGSSTALRLAAAGHRVALLDRSAFPRDKACSEYGSPETVRELAALGVLDALEAHGTTPLTGNSVVGAHGSAMHGRFDRAGGAPYRATGLALPRRLLDATLVRAAVEAGAALHERHAVVGVARDRGAMQVAVRTPEGTRTITARVVVGADGLRSVVARRVGLARRSWLSRTAFVAHVAGVRGLADHAEMHVGRAGYVGLNPLGGDVANVALVVPTARAAEAAGDAAGFFFRTLETFPGVRGRVAASRVVREVLVTGPFDAMSRRSADDGVVLVGDAADFFDPFTGEGICSALRGGRLAAEVLDHALRQPGPLDADRLAAYRRLRRDTFGSKWIVERLIGYAMLAPRLFDASLAVLEATGRSHRMVGVTGGFLPVKALLT
jgi:menaquinone-9 beta-reductase